MHWFSRVDGAGIGSDIYYFGHSVSDALLNLFAMKMAGVFMFSTCTIALRTAILARWLAFAGYACALCFWYWLLPIGDRSRSSFRSGCCW